MSKKKKSSGGLLVFGIFWTAFSSIFAIVGLKTGYDAYNRSGWPETPCEVSRFEVAAKPDTDPPFQPKVQYSYTWSDTSYTGDRVWADQKGENDYEDLSKLIEQYQQGKLTSCHVNPDNPAESVLIAAPGDIWGGVIFTLFGLAFMGVGVGMIIASRKQKKNKTAALSSRKSDNQAPRAIMIPFFSIFALAGLGLLVFLIIPQWVKYTDAKGWVKTPAKVIWSRVESHTDDDGTTYSVDIFYSYEFGGKQYKSNTVDLMSGSSSGRKSKQEKVNANPPGKEIVCYVNPDKPWQALLERELSWWALFSLFPLPFLGVGIGGLWWLLRKKATSTSSLSGRAGDTSQSQLTAGRSDNPLGRSGNPLGRSSSSLRHEAHGSDDFHVSARRTFKPGGKRIGWLFGSMALALFWNGITSVFVWQAVKSWQSGRPEWFLTIFITPFVLIGLGLIAHVFYRFLALFNPKPILTLTPGEITLNEPAKINWQLSGNANRLTKFAIYLIGEEEAKYRRGTNTVTETEVFFQQALIETLDPRRSITGSTKIDLPTNHGNLMPSWQSEHNQIRWSLHVRGEISLWPDITDKYAVTVRPVNIQT
ncbi:MAG: DUF3592 domain-containing protein [Verrucomicrobiae bacterium]|nr:DUF3592 domain-containing protein [Verrucomicrobiae bacterium]NNJ86070.1 DUF3592 domain-containing protein [Akkermansiaceae bacterium]